MEEWQMINAAQTEVKSHKEIMENVAKIVEENRTDAFLAAFGQLVNSCERVYNKVMRLNGTKRKTSSKARKDPKVKVKEVEKTLRKAFNPKFNISDVNKQWEQLCLKGSFAQMVARVKELINEGGNIQHQTLVRNFFIGLYLEEMKKVGEDELVKILVMHNINLSVKYAFFLIRLAKLLKAYPKLIQCNQSMFWWKTNIAYVSKLCQQNQDYWKGADDEVLHVIGGLFENDMDA